MKMTYQHLELSKRIAGYLLLTSAHYHSNGADDGLCIKLRSAIAAEMDIGGLLMAVTISQLTVGQRF